METDPLSFNIFIYQKVFKERFVWMWEHSTFVFCANVTVRAESINKKISTMSNVATFATFLYHETYVKFVVPF